MGLMDFGKAYLKDGLERVQRSNQRKDDAEDEAYGMDAEELASAMNRASGDRLYGYAKAAKNRGDIGRDSSGRFYAK